MPCQMHREPVPKEVGAAELTALCHGAAPLLYCGSSCGQVCVWDTWAGRCFLAWEADDGEIGRCSAGGPLVAQGQTYPWEPRCWHGGPGLQSRGLRKAAGHHPCLLGVLLCAGSRLVSGSNTRRLRLWAVGAVPELRRKGSGAR